MDMIAKLMQEAAEEADKKAFCDKDLSESKVTKADKEGKIAKLESRIEQAEHCRADRRDCCAFQEETNAAVSESTGVRDQESALW